MLIFLLLFGSPSVQAGDASKGRSIYSAKCMSCHGRKGNGDGPAARALPVQPPDMTSSEFWTKNNKETIKGVLDNGTPGGIMRAFPVTDTQFEDLYTYLESLKK